MRISLIVIALAGLTYLVVLGTHPDDPVAPCAADTSAGPSFDVRIVKPRLARPLFGLVPEGILDSKLRFDHGFPGADGRVDPERLELSADGWKLLIETDAEGNVAPGSHVTFPIELANKQLTLRCRPADPAAGYLRLTPRADSDDLDGSFVVEFASCEQADTGKAIDWPTRPLTVRGCYEGLSRSH